MTMKKKMARPERFELPTFWFVARIPKGLTRRFEIASEFFRACEVIPQLFPKWQRRKHASREPRFEHVHKGDRVRAESTQDRRSVLGATEYFGNSQSE